jgi:hypothetical protein
VGINIMNSSRIAKMTPTAPTDGTDASRRAQTPSTTTVPK